jgi:hypothetical protein
VYGEFNGFITNIALSGVCRLENNEQAKKLGYAPGQWPITPLKRQVIKQNLRAAIDERASRSRRR